MPEPAVDSGTIQTPDTTTTAPEATFITGKEEPVSATPDATVQATEAKPVDDGAPKEDAAQTETKDEKAPEGAPEKYEFKAPEGMVLDEAAVTAFEPWARKHNLTQEAAQELVDLYAAQVGTSVKQFQDAVAKQREDWMTFTKADPELGGHKLAETRLAVQRGMERYKKDNAAGHKELSELMDSTGIGNSPAVIRLMAWVGKAMAEDTIVTSTGTTPEDDNSPGARAQRMFAKSLGSNPSKS